MFCTLNKLLKIRSLLILLWAISLLMAAGLAGAQVPTVEISPSAEPIDLSPVTWLLEDKQGSLSIAQVREPEYAAQFNLKSASIGPSTSAYWLRFNIKNSTSKEASWWFDTGNRTLQEVDFFAPDESGHYQRLATGSTYRFAERPLPTTTFVFPLNLPPEKSVEIFLRVRSTGYVGVMVKPKLWQVDSYWKAAHKEQTHWLLYMGMVIALGFYNLFLYFSIRDTDYIIYILSLISLAMRVSTANGGYGNAFEFLWPDSPVFEQTIWAATIITVCLFPVLFGQRLTKMHLSLPRLRNFVNACIAILGVIVLIEVLCTVLQLNNVTGFLQIIYPVGVLPFILATLGNLYGLTVLARSGNRQAMFILIAWTPVTLSAVFFAAMSALVKSMSIEVTVWASAFELLMMSLALADRYSQDRKAKAEAQAELVSVLQRTERELESRVALRTEELEHLNQVLKSNEIDLEKAKQEAISGSTLKSQFLANMSHEIRTPMNAIIGMAHLALRTELDPKLRDYLEKIQGASNSLLGIINDILDFSKIEAGKLRFEQIDFDLADVMERLADLLTINAQKKGLELLFDIGADVPMSLVGDPLRLGQVLTNLVSNAIKFTGQGEITVLVRLDAPPTASDQVRLKFEVQDTGVGLSEQQCQRLFIAFTQADASTTRKYGGTGLGLTISKRLVELMGGEIMVQSKQGVGSRFSFTAWLGLQQQQTQRELNIDSLRILVVDDNASAREIFSTMIASLGHTVSVARSGLEALDKLDTAQREGQPYGLVIVDWQMPELDGIQTIKRIRLNALNMPICMMVTAYSRDELLHDLGDLHIDGLLIKPVSPSMLSDTLMTAFGKQVKQRQGLRQFDYRQLQAALNGGYVLLVEDNEINRDLALELLISAGMRVDIAVNGQDALEKISASDYDAILMDCQMPVMDGFEATKILRAELRYAKLPVIAMTANVMAEDREKCLACGMDDHIGKPINVAQLYTTLARWVKPKYSTSERVPATVSVESDVLAIEGIDVADGLARTMGNTTFYKQLLTRFHRDQSNVPEKIREALNCGDRISAERLAHTLKGVAGQVGASGIEALAAQLESGIARGAEEEILRQLTQSLAADLSQLQDKMASVLDPLPAKEANSGTANPAELPVLIERFAALLRDYDGDAFELLAQSDAQFSAVLGSTAHREILDAASRFDFEGALSTLVKATQAAEPS